MNLNRRSFVIVAGAAIAAANLPLFARAAEIRQIAAGLE